MHREDSFRKFQRAIKIGDFLLVEECLSKCGDPNFRFSHGWTPLHCAAKAGKADMIPFLISKGAETNIETDHRKTPLDVALAEQMQSTIDALRQHGGKLAAELSLHSAIYAGDFDRAQNKVLGGAAINEINSGELPICIAFRRGYINFAKFLFKHGAEMDIKESDGTTGLAAAVEAGADEDFISAILNGTKINSPESLRRALNIAAGDGNKSIVSLLIKSGADASTRPHDGENTSPLYEALSNQKFEIARHLINCGVKFSLYEAVQMSDIELVKQKLDEGVDVNGRNRIDSSPLIEAVERAHFEIAKLLLENGGDANARTHRLLGLETPLHIAVQKRALNFVKLLKNYGADSNIRNAQGDTPLDLAEQQKCVHLLPLLKAESGFLSSPRVEQLYTIERVAGILSVDLEFVQTLINQQKLKTVTLAKGVVRIPEKSTREYQQSIGI